MIYTEQELLTFLTHRRDWYRKAMQMKMQIIPWQNGFSWPTGDIATWEGAVNELQNTINIMLT